MTRSLLESLDSIRASLNGTSNRKERSKIGQFLTPSPIARFMASLFEQECKHVRILDPGAGAGVLFAACVATLASRTKRPTSIEVVAYEDDRRILPYLEETVRHCRSLCSDVGISFHGVIEKEDFIAAGVSQTQDRLFATEGESFTHTILNPPYKKINVDSRTRRLLDSAKMEVSNLYAAFVWLAVRMLKPGGELVAITPRSFCNGPYFRRFRVNLLGLVCLKRIHVFASRKKAFADDGVLQENMILHAVRADSEPRHVVISASEGSDFQQSIVRSVPYEQVVLPQDSDFFLHLPESDRADEIVQRMRQFNTTLDELGLDVSTGRVVDFRAKPFLRLRPQDGTVPLVYPCHFQDGFVRWPSEQTKKPNAILYTEYTKDLMVSSGHYVLTKRFTSKEEPRRVVAAIYDPLRVSSPLVGFENHLNYFHAQGKGLCPNIAKGLALYLNSSLFDRHFRLFSGHTQVNATDLRKVRYPSRSELLRLASHVGESLPDQRAVDAVLESECRTHG